MKESFNKVYKELEVYDFDSKLAEQMILFEENRIQGSQAVLFMQEIRDQGIVWRLPERYQQLMKEMVSMGLVRDRDHDSRKPL